MDVSVIIPTHNRREQLRQSLITLQKQIFKGEGEFIVIADGCTDGTAKMLKNDFSNVKSVIFEKNVGAAVALNAGVKMSTGDILLFLDDDMEYRQGLIAAHLQMHDQGSYQVIIGHFPLGYLPNESYFRQVIYDWTEGWQKCFGEDVSFFDSLCSGHFSIRREWYEKVGGFDEDFSKWGRKDSELGFRLIKARARFGYCPQARSVQNYDKLPSQFLSDFQMLGKADVEMCGKHPELRQATLLSCYYQAPWPVRWLRQLGQKCSELVQILTENLAGYFDGLHQIGYKNRVTEGFFWILADYFYWQGAQKKLGDNFGSYFGQPLKILLYHRIADDSDAFSVSVKTFEVQMRFIVENGYSVISLADATEHMVKGEVPEKAVVITFDDGYEDFLEAHKILRQFNFPVTLFMPTAYIGKTNAWETETIQSGLQILNHNQLRLLIEQGVDVQAHGYSHSLLGSLSKEEQEFEITRCLEILEKDLGVFSRFFSYPSGSFSDTTVCLLEQHGCKAGVTCISTLASKDSDLMQLPRISIEEGSLEDFAMRLEYGIGLRYARQEFLEHITRFRPTKWWHTAPEFDSGRIYIYQSKRPKRKE